MEEPQPSTSRSAAVDDEEPTRRSAVEDDSSSSSSSIDLEDEPPTKRRLYVEEVHVQCEMWNIVKVFRKLGTRELAVAFAEDRGMIPREKNCNHHKKKMNVEYSSNKTVGSFVCYKRPCRSKSKVSRGKGTWFHNIKITMTQLFYIMYAYAEKFSYSMAIKQDFSEEHRLSTATICDWYNNCREAVVAYQKNKELVTGKIGGPGKIVQIDERKFGSRSSTIVSQVEGQWVLGLIEDGSDDLRLEICLDNVGSAEVLVPLIKKHVAEGTTIHTHSKRAYDCLGDHGYIHRKVNHCAPDNPEAEDGTHTQRIELQWRAIKRFFYNLNNRTHFEHLLHEFLWRRDLQINRRDPFEELINVINFSYNK